jgi:hypothetical protein
MAPSVLQVSRVQNLFIKIKLPIKIIKKIEVKYITEAVFPVMCSTSLKRQFMCADGWKHCEQYSKQKKVDIDKKFTINSPINQF